jgi:hypothetical protein
LVYALWPVFLVWGLVEWFHDLDPADKWLCILALSVIAILLW